MKQWYQRRVRGGQTAKKYQDNMIKATSKRYHDSGKKRREAKKEHLEQGEGKPHAHKETKETQEAKEAKEKKDTKHSKDIKDNLPKAEKRDLQIFVDQKEIGEERETKASEEKCSKEEGAMKRKEINEDRENEDPSKEEEESKEENSVSAGETTETLPENGVELAGQVHQELSENKIGLKDFERIKMIGLGCIGHVYLVRLKGTKRYYAMKVLKKKDMIKLNKVNIT
eukprot:TRINITY_DN2955_c0_g4_i13.p1 TRINITY_DN2955_c0_g4~~TRINITY_DN2955_c0_g4_i13.p1  ORF type:complete len:227 (+),score=73.29 TRINITY_DN2955_c0_g4_i13:22-702(+)